MESTSSLPSDKPRNDDAKKNMSLDESGSEEEFFDAVFAASSDDDNIATREETHSKDLGQQPTSNENETRMVGDLIKSESLRSAEDATADDADGEDVEDATRTCKDVSDGDTSDGDASDCNASDGGSRGSDFKDEQFYIPVEHDKLCVPRNGTIENTGPYGDTTNPEALRVEEGGDDEERAEPDEVDGGVILDEEAVRDLEEQMTEDEKQDKRSEAQIHKAQGNELFKSGVFADAVYAYGQALRLCPLCYKKDRSIMYANRAACKVKQEDLEGAITDCTKALELNPLYLKVVLRRAQAYELTDKLEDSLKDYQRVLELDPGCYEARAACMRLPDQIKERNEKLKTEMMSKLKDLGNLCLRPFGLSTDNFQLNQDPATGSYSVNFNQNREGNNGK